MTVAANEHPPASRAPSARRDVVQPRLIPGVLFVVCMSLLIVAAMLDPSEKGVGTHTSMGLPECGMVQRFNTPCPTCGMTTSFAHAANGHLLTSFANQPMGALLALATAVTAIITGWAVVVGMPLAPVFSPFARPAVYWSAGGIFLLSWLYKIGIFWGWFA